MTQYSYQGRVPPLIPPGQIHRLGDWIMTTRGIGIVYDWTNNRGYIIHLVDNNGETTEEIACLQNEMRPAMPWELPLSRRHLE